MRSLCAMGGGGKERSNCVLDPLCAAAAKGRERNFWGNWMSTTKQIIINSRAAAVLTPFVLHFCSSVCVTEKEDGNTCFFPSPLWLSPSRHSSGEDGPNKPRKEDGSRNVAKKVPSVVCSNNRLLCTDFLFCCCSFFCLIEQ